MSMNHGLPKRGQFRRLMGYGRFDGVETARVMARLYAAARLYVNFFQPSFKLKEKRREGAKVIKRYHPPSTPCERALAHPKVAAAVKTRLRDQYRTLDPVALLAEIRALQEQLGNRVDRRAGDGRGQHQAGQSTAPPMQSSAPDAVAFAKTLGTTVEACDPRATHRRFKRTYKTRVRMPSKLDPHVATIEDWLAAEPQLTALAIVGRLSESRRRPVLHLEPAGRAAPCLDRAGGTGALRCLLDGEAVACGDDGMPSFDARLASAVLCIERSGAQLTASRPAP